jgi:nitrogenase molybdenum-iron protein NifN
MAPVVKSKKAYGRNPLKSSAPLGAALAYLGVEGAVPLLHGSQGCATYGLALAMSHLDENLSLQSSALSEISAVLGSMESLEQALLTVQASVKPKLIGIASTALVETTGEDWIEQVRMIRARRARELHDTVLVSASTPDFDGAIEEGWAAAVRALIDALVDGPLPRVSGRINVLPGVHQTPAELEELRRYCSLFGLSARIVPDLRVTRGSAAALQHENTRAGGARIADLARLGEAVHTLAFGEHMRGPAELLSQRTHTPHTVLHAWTGLEGSDALVRVLTQLSGVAAPVELREQRQALIDACLDSQHSFAGKRIAIASDPELLYTLAQVFTSLGADIVSAVASTSRSRILARVPVDRVLVSDLGDFEEEARATRAELLVTHSRGSMAAERLGVPLFRVGFPIFDRFGVQDRCWLGYAGTRRLVYEVANLLQPRWWASDGPRVPA